MSWTFYIASYFVAWWLVLFAMLPFSLRTQDDEGDVTLGTVPSAPAGRHMLRAVIRTTIVTTLLFGAVYVLIDVLGYSIEDLPRIAPEAR